MGSPPHTPAKHADGTPVNGTIWMTKDPVNGWRPAQGIQGTAQGEGDPHNPDSSHMYRKMEDWGRAVP